MARATTSTRALPSRAVSRLAMAAFPGSDLPDELSQTGTPSARSSKARRKTNGLSADAWEMKMVLIGQENPKPPPIVPNSCTQSKHSRQSQSKSGQRGRDKRGQATGTKTKAPNYRTTDWESKTDAA